MFDTITFEIEWGFVIVNQLLNSSNLLAYLICTFIFNIKSSKMTVKFKEYFFFALLIWWFRAGQRFDV